MASSREQLMLVLEPVLIPQLVPQSHWPNCSLGSVSGHLLPPGGFCQAEADPQTPHLISSEEQESA